MIRQTFFYFLARGGPALVNLLAIAIYTRHLEPGEYGIYALTVSGAALFNTVLFYWLRAGIARFFHAHEANPTRLLSTLLRAFLGMMILTGGAGLVLYPFQLIEPRFLLLGVLLVWGFAGFEIALELARSRMNPKSYGILNLSKSLMSIGVKVSLILGGMGAEAPLIGMIIAMSLVIGYAGVRERHSIQRSEYDGLLLKEIFGYAAPLTVVAGLTFVISTSDRFLLAYLGSSADVGIYAAAYDLALFGVGTILMVINVAAYPAVVRALDTEGPAAAREQLATNLTTLFLLGLPTMTGLIMCAKNVAHLILGPEFAATGVHIIQLIAVAGLLSGLKSYYADLSFHLAKDTRVHMVIVAIAALTNVALNIVWISAYGIIGAAFATVASYFIGLSLSVLLGRRSFALPGPSEPIWKIIVAVLLMGVVLAPLRDLIGPELLVLQVLTGIFVYGVAITAMNVMGLRAKLTRSAKDFFA